MASRNVCIKNTIKSIKNDNEKKITYDLKTTMLMVKTANTTTTDDEKKGIAASVTTAIVVPGKKQIQDLPNELLLIICSFSNAKLLVKTEYVSKFWKHFSFHNLNERILWNRLYKKHFISQPEGFFISKATTCVSTHFVCYARVTFMITVGFDFIESRGGISLNLVGFI